MGTLRIAHIIPDGEFGGAQEYLASLVVEQTALDVVPLILSGERGPFVRRYREAGTLQIIPALGARVSPFRNFQALYTLARTLTAYKPDVIHGHTSRGLMFAALLRHLLGVPAIASIHGFSSAHALMNPVAARVATWVKCGAVRRFDAVTVAAEAIRTMVVALGVPPEKVHVVYAGIDFGRFYPRSTPRRGPARVGAAGRFIAIKGFRHYVEAACALLDRHHVAEFHLYGDGPEEPLLRSIVASSGHAAHVRILPFQPNFPDILRDWDIAVVPSVVDSFPFVSLEAMATGIPVVASAVGGIPEAIQDGEHGLLISPGRADLLIAAIERLLANPGERARMGAAGLATCRRRFTWKQAAVDYLELYDHVLGRARTDRTASAHG